MEFTDETQKRLYRRCRACNLWYCASSDIYVGPALCTLQLWEAFHLVHEQYVNCQYLHPHASSFRYGIHTLLPDSCTIVAVHYGQVVSTGSAILGNMMALPAEEIFPEEIEARRALGRRVYEGTLFAGSLFRIPQGQRLSREILRCGLWYGEAMGVDDAFLVTHPRHVNFYRDFFGVEVLASRRRVDSVNGKPGCLLHLDLRAIREGKLKPTAPHKRFVINRKIPASDYAKHARLRGPEVSHFLVRTPEILANVSLENLRVLERCYPGAIKRAINILDLKGEKYNTLRDEVSETAMVAQDEEAVPVPNFVNCAIKEATGKQKA